VPSLRVHCAISKQRTGFEFEELHRWIDEGAKSMGVDHREKRHYFNRKDQREIKDRWGEKAVVEWLFHIALDNLGTAYKFSLSKSSYGANTYNYLRVILNPNGYIDCKFDRIPRTPSFTR
jgi:hypothetical protein